MVDIDKLNNYLKSGLEIAAYNGASAAMEELTDNSSSVSKERKKNFSTKFAKNFSKNAAEILCGAVNYILANIDITGTLPVTGFTATATAAPSPAVKGTVPGMLKLK